MTFRSAISRVVNNIINALISFVTLVAEGIAVLLTGVLLLAWLIGFLLFGGIVSGLTSLISLFLPSFLGDGVTMLVDLFIVLLFFLGPVVVSSFIISVLTTDDGDLLPDPYQYSFPSVWLLPPLTVVAIRPDVLSQPWNDTALLSIGVLLGVMVFRGFLYAFIHYIRAGSTRNPIASVIENISGPFGHMVLLAAAFAWLFLGLQIHLLGYIFPDIATDFIEFYAWIPLTPDTSVGFFAVPLAITGMLVLPWLAVGCFGIIQATYRQIRSMITYVLETIVTFATTTLQTIGALVITVWHTIVTFIATIWKAIVSLIVTTGKLSVRLVEHYIFLRP